MTATRKHNISRFLVLLLLGTAVTAASVAQSVSEQLNERTGHRLSDRQRSGPAVFSLPPGVSLGDQLSVHDAVAIALWNNAALEADLAGLDVSRADLLEAGLLRNPTLSTLLPVGPKPFEFLLSWPIEELWQRKRRVKAAQLNVDAVATGLVQNGLNLIRDVRAAHADLWLAEQRARILQESATLRGRIAELTERRRNAGDASGLDVGLARADAWSAGEQAKRALNEVEIVRTRLRRLLGMRGEVKSLSATLEQPADFALPSHSSLLETAMSSRPDLRAAELGVESSAERAKWQRSRVIAMLTPTLSVKDVGSSGIRTGPGLTVETPVFTRNQGQISRADAEVLRAGLTYAAIKDQVEQEVLEARERVLQAQISMAQLGPQVLAVVDQAIRQTESAYRSGDLSLLNVLEATRQRYDVALREVEAQAALQQALAELERAIGRSL